jgi:hypothetical protein
MDLDISINVVEHQSTSESKDKVQSVAPQEGN